MAENYFIPVGNTGGGVIVSQRSYPVGAATVIQAGQAVKLTGGLVVPAEAAETGAILGVAAETHSGKEDALNGRANWTEILVCDGPGLVSEADYSGDAPAVDADFGFGMKVIGVDTALRRARTVAKRHSLAANQA